MCWGREPSREGCEAAFRLARTSCGVPKQRPAGLYGGPDTGRGTGALEEGGENDPEREQAWKGEILALYRRCADSGDRRVRERAERMLISQYMAQGELEQAEEQLARLPQEDRERPMLEAMLRRKQKRSEEAWPILEQGAVPAGIRSPVYPHGFDGPGAGGRGTRRARGNTVRRRSRRDGCSSSPPTQWCLPAPAGAGGAGRPRGAGGAGTAPAQPGGALGPECVPSLPPLAHKGGCEGSPADHAPISAGGTGAGPGIRFPPGDPPDTRRCWSGSTGQKYR